MIELLCALHLSFWMNCPSEAETFVGYVEGEYVEIAPTANARVNELLVQRGDILESGSLIAILEDTDALSAVNQAVAAVTQAESELANLLSGQRPEELAVIEAELNSARAAQAEAQRNSDRLQRLSDSGQFVSTADLDAATTAVETGQARVEEVEANLAVAKLGAREEEIQTARAALQQAKANRVNAEWLLSERQVHSPAKGIVSQILKRQAEVAGPSAPIIQMLPDTARVVIFYIPQQRRSDFREGEAVEVNCSACGQAVELNISYIGAEVEYTPPVIYSADRRQELVYRVEARAPAENLSLTPGQIVDVQLLP